MRRQPYGFWLLLWVLGIAGCSARAPLVVEMALKVTNTADRMLVVEGVTNLPAGSVLSAQLTTRDREVLRRAKGTVSHGKTFFVFDLSDLTKFHLFRLLVSFDPEKAPLGARFRTGWWGEALQGPGVIDRDGRRFWERDQMVVVAKGVEGRPWEGLDFATLDIGERARLVREMERAWAGGSDDRSMMLALAQAYVATDPSELATGTRAYELFKAVMAGGTGDRLGREASNALIAIEDRQEREQLEAKQRKIDARRTRFQADLVIRPGRSIGSVYIGAPLRVLKNQLVLDTPLNFKGRRTAVTVYPRNLPGLEVTFDPDSERVIRVRTTSRAYRLPEGLGVGARLQELQQAYGRDAVPTPSWEYLGAGPDGRELYRGVSIAAGLKFELRHEIEPTLGSEIDWVSAVVVIPELDEVSDEPLEEATPPVKAAMSPPQVLKDDPNPSPSPGTSF